MVFMHLFFIILFFPFLSHAEFDEGEFILLDGIDAVCIGEGGIAPVFSSDVWFTNPFFGHKTIAEFVVETALLSYANDHSMKKLGESQQRQNVEEYFDMLLAQKKISKATIEEILTEYGTNISEMKKILCNQFTIQQTLEMYFTASGVLHVSDEEILEYYHCMDTEERDTYELQIGELQSNNGDMSLEDISMLQDKIVWGECYQVKKKDLKKSLYDCQCAADNEIFYVEYDTKKCNYDVYKLVRKIPAKKILLADVYDEISRKIQMIKYEENYKNLVYSLIRDDNMIYINLNVKNKVDEYVG
jgi:hypothetical protein